ncbi:hypothetical protein HIM_03500 [Hirsutella minnesotensis 3608]|uniref:SEC7 domain-containing protein n=1 Tax=Hirsutella minnesotensis 3608 TaxID=1043627 RepID=A0A0F8A6J3_9HYPO|nr:hypothetical protein HIM_03500 [Hirsutella minnesotensis 3608]
MADHPSPRRARDRDSHDLALGHATRDSLVTNMLLSLDQLSLAQNQHLQSPGAPASRPAVSAAYDDYSARLWANNAPSGSRLHHSAHSSHDDIAAMRDPSNRVRPGTAPRINTHARGGTRGGSVSSGTASTDVAHPPVSSANRRGRAVRRSSSLDRSSPTHALHKPTLSSPFQPDFPEEFALHGDDTRSPLPGGKLGATDFDDYNAAPMPTVPSGPRHDASGGFRIPPPPPEPVQLGSTERNRSSSFSTKGSSSARKRSNGHRTTSARASSPVMAAADVGSAPAPSVGYRKPKDKEKEKEKEKDKEKEADSPTVVSTPAKERTGFFRRVFGGGSSRNNLQGVYNNGGNDQQDSSRSPTSPDRTQRPSSNKSQQQAQSGQSKAGSAAPTRDFSSSSLTQPQPPLQKKSSSFFRRRKKIVLNDPSAPGSDRVSPPVPSLNTFDLPAAKEVSASAQKSPTSSLRVVMNPYLNEGATGLGLSNVQTSALGDIANASGERAIPHADKATYKRGFSSEYDPRTTARIRTVRSEDGGGRPAAGPSTPVQTAVPRSREASDTGDSSFLDLEAGSDNEVSSSERRKRKESASDKTKHANRKNSNASRCYGSEPSEAVHDEHDPDATLRASRSRPFVITDSSDRDSRRPSLAPPPDAIRATSPRSLASSEADWKTAPSAPPSVRVEGAETKAGDMLDEPEFIVGAPTDDDRQKAHQIFDGSEGFIPKDKAAAWMGEEGPVRQRTLQAYMELYDFKDQSILVSLRTVCERLVLRAETQQVDRILVAFANRWCLCNPNHGFEATDVIHTICYSIMLLNTDLHLADIEQKMTRSQFVKNTMTSIMQVVAESAPNAFSRPSILPEKSASILGSEQGRASPDLERIFRRSSFLPRSETQSSVADESGPLVNAPFHGSKKAWEEQIEVVLKNTYTSIRDQKLPLFGAEPDKHLGGLPTQNNLSVMSMLKRSPSVLSKAPSETQLSSRGRIAESSRTSASRWTSKSRSRPGMGRHGFSSSRTSFDDGNSVWSPAMSSATWSRYSLGRTQGSASQDSFAQSRPRGDYQQSIGFANALSQAIVREEDPQGNDTAMSIRSAEGPEAQLLEDETLELAGPPWVKEGIVTHKHHLDGMGKKARDRNWTEVFAVIQKGQLSLFSFTSNKSSTRQKVRAKNTGKHSGPVGGGNWQDNAVNLGAFNLRLTLASALPPPGYSRTRPHVWALSLPNGAVHLFQVGTAEIIREFVHTANYWSARLSTHPLVGGISNVEYGWSEAVVNTSLIGVVNDSSSNAARPGSNKGSRPGSSAAHARKSSVTSGSFRAASFDQVAGSFTHGSGRGGKLPGDRIHIAAWTTPPQSMRASRAPEAEQLETLSAYVKSIEDDLQAHNRLRSPMLLAFTPRSQNAGKAMANWERKSAHLLREIVKFRTYVDCLQHAQTRKREVYAERTLAQKAARGELDEGEVDASDGELGDETLKPE